jgi:hypothetical protein
MTSPFSNYFRSFPGSRQRWSQTIITKKTCLKARTSEYPDCRLLQIFAKPLCNQIFAFNTKYHWSIIMKNQHTHTIWYWLDTRSIYILWIIPFTAHTVVKLGQIGRMWTYYTAKSDSSMPFVLVVARTLKSLVRPNPNLLPILVRFVRIGFESAILTKDLRFLKKRFVLKIWYFIK